MPAYKQIIMRLGGQIIIGYIPVTYFHYAYCNLHWQLYRAIKIDICELQFILRFVLIQKIEKL